MFRFSLSVYLKKFLCLDFLYNFIWKILMLRFSLQFYLKKFLCLDFIYTFI